MIGSLLIANRGEIAVRIARTCKRLGIRTVAVYSDADRDAKHVRVADTAIRIGPAPARESYLRLDAIMEAAKRAGVEAIHPGYGFLSEKPELAEACVASGLVFIGPSAACIKAMGSKIGAKRIADSAGVPSVPGYKGDDQSTDRLIAEAMTIGLPVMIKASAGGGGKGIRRVRAADELKPAIEIARREAQAAFGDGSLLVERLVEQPRHIEVQIAGDKHGQVIHLFERDCSVQRNNQKLIEEAPAPNLGEAVRAKLLDRAIKLARAISYDNLGTVEFILEEGQTEPWFLEMNTRLQVEHAVTEAVTGFDLVEWQLRIASGERLPAAQNDVVVRGHAIEARIVAERPAQGFIPDTGKIVEYQEPTSVRVDSGVETGSDVTLYYDSLLAKAIAFGNSRDEARSSLARALDDYCFLGVATAKAFLADALRHPIFAEGRATTRFIESAFPEGWRATAANARLARNIAALLAVDNLGRGMGSTLSAWTSLPGFRVLSPAGGNAQVHLAIAVEDGPPSAVTVVAEKSTIRQVRDENGDMTLTLRASGQTFEADADGQVFRGVFHIAGQQVLLALDGQTYTFAVALASSASAKLTVVGKSGTVLATMPGVVCEVRVSVGDRVRAGDVLMVMESMKLFITIAASSDGTIAEILSRPLDTVKSGQRLLVVEPDAA